MVVSSLRWCNDAPRDEMPRHRRAAAFSSLLMLRSVTQNAAAYDSEFAIAAGTAGAQGNDFTFRWRDTGNRPECFKAFVERRPGLHVAEYRSCGSETRAAAAGAHCSNGDAGLSRFFTPGRAEAALAGTHSY